MKNLTKFQKFLVILLAVCLPIGIIGIFATMTTSRDATAEELALYGAYDVAWDSLPGEEGQTLTERILAQCTLEGKESAGDNEYDSYSSGTLGQYLHGCATLDKVLTDGSAVYIYYTDTAGISVFLTCGSSGVTERSAYDSTKDIMFYQSGETAIVYEHFSNYAAR